MSIVLGTPVTRTKPTIGKPASGRHWLGRMLATREEGRLRFGENHWDHAQKTSNYFNSESGEFKYKSVP